MKLFDIEDKVILVTGACGVLGGGIVKYLLENRATVILLALLVLKDSLRPMHLMWCMVVERVMWLFH